MEDFDNFLSLKELDLINQIIKSGPNNKKIYSTNLNLKFSYFKSIEDFKLRKGGYKELFTSSKQLDIVNMFVKDYLNKTQFKNSKIIVITIYFGFFKCTMLVHIGFENEKLKRDIALYTYDSFEKDAWENIGSRRQFKNLLGYDNNLNQLCTELLLFWIVVNTIIANPVIIKRSVPHRSTKRASAASVAANTRQKSIKNISIRYEYIDDNKNESGKRTYTWHTNAFYVKGHWVTRKRKDGTIIKFFKEGYWKHPGKNNSDLIQKTTYIV
jgi:hypothetical protein